MNRHPSIEKALRHIETHYHQALTLDEVAQESALSKYHFARTFKSETGVTFKTYLNQVRIGRAKALLNNGAGSITEVCYEVGFNDISYFDRVFRRMEGVSPTAYKARLLLAN